jgi:hypothetical protein
MQRGVGRREGVSSASEFAWQAQLRYAWSDTNDEISILQAR